MRRSVTYVRKTALVGGPTKNHTARTVPVPALVARLIETEVVDRDGGALVFESARGGGFDALASRRSETLRCDVWRSADVGTGW